MTVGLLPLPTAGTVWKEMVGQWASSTAGTVWKEKVGSIFSIRFRAKRDL